MDNQNKISLLEATQMALLGKLELTESKPVKESVSVTTDDTGNTYVETDDATVMIQEKQDELPEEAPVESVEVVEIPVEGDETIIPEEVVEPEVVEEITDEIAEVPAEETDEEEHEEVEEPVEESCEKLEETDDMSAIIAKIEAEYGRKLTDEEIRLVKTVGPIMACDKDKKTEDIETIEKIEEPVEEVNELSEESSDKEIIDHIVDDFEKITGVEIASIFNSSEDEDAPLFNQTVIDSTSEPIFMFLDSIGIKGTRLTNVIEQLDDALATKYNEVHKALETPLEESKEIKTEAIAGDGNCIFSLKMECTSDAFGGIDENGEGDPDALQAEVARILSKLAEKIANGDYTNDGSLLDANGNVVGKYGFGYEGVVQPFKEAKEIKTESSDATQEFIDELAALLKKYSRTGVESMELVNDGDEVVITFKGGGQKTAHIAADSVTAAIKDIIKVAEDKKIDLDSFSKALTEHFNKEVEGNTFAASSVTPEDNKLVVEGKLTTVDGIEKEMKLEFNSVQKGKTMTKYALATAKNLVENKASTILVTKLTKEGLTECHSISKIN